MTDLILAVPSKGRLQEEALEFLSRSGLKVARARGGRDYRGAIAGLPGVEVAFLSASEIARELAAGNAHLGLTGLDLLHETVEDDGERAARIHIVAPLGFGRADVVVAVPESWIDVEGMADLADVAEMHRARHDRTLRVATKFVHLTRRHFAAAGVADYRIVESLGATEGAPAAGVADLIVDITTTGATLAANQLRVLSDGTILQSEAHFVASRAASWNAVRRELAATVVERIAAEMRAQAVLELRAVVEDPAAVAGRAAELFDAVAPFGPAPVPLTLHVPRRRASAAAAWLRGAGAGAVVLTEVRDVYEDTALVPALLAALG
jgi:ATP phosphoribosyltransferase